MTFLTTALLLTILLIIVVAGVTTVIGFLLARVPYVPSSRRVTRAMVHLARVRPGERIVDLGAGDARLLIEAVRACPGAVASGYELVPTVWLLGKLRLRLAGLRVPFTLGDAFRADLSQANVIFLYLLPEVMPRLAVKFDAELAPGTRVISHAFTFPSRTPAERVVLPGSRPQRLYLYVW